MTIDLDQDVQIAAALPRTWPYFFESFGRLTPVQRVAIPPILAGADALVESATATGKTEAACAPLVERCLSFGHPWTILYISPTRALVNDLFERLELPLGQLRLRLDRRTGEYRPPSGPHINVLITTPESFDSMLCRGKTSSPVGHSLAAVTSVVLDEVHLLHGTARGEQVRWLLHRLRKLRAQAKRANWTPTDHVQVVALSATLSNPGDVVQQFVPHGVRITVAGGRGIETIDTPEGTWAVESALPSYLKASGRSEKTLVFANSRIRVDSLTADLRRDLASSGYTVVAHHGSLDRSEREATEEAVKARSRIVVVATATLEIGIDIGDIDLVVLDGPPPDIPSLLQRIGRGNRRRGTTRVMVCNSGALEALVSSAMIAAARESWLGTGERGPQYAVARQQTASYVFQAPRRARPRAKIQELLDCCATPVVARGLLDSLLAAGELLEDSDGIRLGDHWLEASSRGEIHSCIEDVGGSRVVDELTGRVIAHAVRSQSGPGLQTGGHLLQVRQWSDFKIEVRRTANVELAAGHWRYGSRPRMQGSGQPEAVRRYLGVPDSEWPVVNDDRWAYCFHFGGARRRSVLDLAAHVARASEGVVVNDWYMRLGLTSFVKPSWLTSAGRATLDIEIASRLEHLERVLGRPRANVHLPLEARIDEVRGWLQIDIELEHFRRARLAPCTGASLRRVLESLVASLR